MSGLVPVAGATGTAQFNTASGDWPVLQVSNYTKYPGSNSNWARTVSADPSDILSFLIFYHNTSNVTAYNTRLKLNLSPTVSSGNVLTAVVSADNAYSSGGSINIYLNYGSNLSLTLVSGSARLYTGSSSTLTAIPFGQSGDEVVTAFNGLRVGDIGPGNSGYVVVRAQLGGYTQSNPTPQGNVPSVSTNSSSNISISGATLNGSVNPNNSGTTAWFEYGPTQSLGYTTSTFSIGGGNSQTSYSASVFNLTSNTAYYYRAIAQNSYGTSRGSVLSFTTQADQIQQPQVSAPFARTEGTSGVSTASVTLLGAANPNGASTEAWFEYGTTQSFGSSTSRQSIGSGTSFSNFSFSLTSLSQNTTYYFRAVAQNNLGTNQGTILSFTTQSGQTSGSTPLVNTTSSSGISTSSATLYGSVNPNNSSTTAWFEYGQTQSFGYTTSSSSIGSGNSYSSFSASIFNLSPNTTYYFRAVAQNSYGTNYGSVLSFSTGSQYVSGNSPFVTTNSASVISVNSATLYGSANPNNSYATGWFEYGTSGYLGNTTSSFTLGSGNSYQSYSSTVFNLYQNTTYYYRAVAQNSYGTAYGALLTFATGTSQATASQDLSGIAYSLSQLTSALAKLNAMVGGLGANRVTERVIEKVEVASTAGSDLAKLTFTADKESLDPGDKVVFTVQIEPLDNLTNTILAVKLDPGFEFESTSASSYSKSENTFTYNLGSVQAGSTQVFKINAHLSSDFNKDDAEDGVVSSTATLAYADASGNAKTPLFSSLDIKVGGAGFFAGIFDALPGGATVTILLIAFLVLLVAIAIKKLLN